MSARRNGANVTELKTYFNTVIDSVSSVFTDVLPEMRGREWRRPYEERHGKSYDPTTAADDVKKRAADDGVENRKGIFEYPWAVRPTRGCRLSGTHNRARGSR